MAHRLILKVQIAVLFLFVSGAEAFSNNLGYPLQKTIVAGMVTEFDNIYDLPAVELINYMPFILEWETQSIYIESNGEFRFEFEQLYPQEYMIGFNEFFTVYCHPGDSIFITIDANLLRDTSGINGYEKKYIQINCQNQEFQDEFQDFLQDFFGHCRTREDEQTLQDAQKILDYSAYSDYVKNRTRDQLEYLEKYFQSKSISAAFQEWARDWIYISELEDLFRYTWLHPMYAGLDRKTFCLPEEFFVFLMNDEHNDEKLYVSQNYRLFLHEYYMYLHRELSQSELSSQFDSLLEANNKVEANNLKLHYILDNTSGFEQQYLVTSFYSQLIFWKMLDVFDALYDPSLVGRDDYNKILSMEYSEIEELIQEPVYAKDLILYDNHSTKDTLIFATLPERFPEKVIYVDFWAPWCGPCMAEMSHSKALQEKLKGKNVVFVFLAAKCSEEQWKATIAQKQLSGEHFLLDEKENSLLADKFEIAGIPRYMIIDKIGQVVNDDAARPSDEGLFRILEVLSEKHITIH